ncbi:PorV/PorQ family protein [Porphyromonas levii]|uniref:PorV/PorQ family protein n=1 Tax=Porphyromonas levii TaxID=28114 RepID=A0A4Y8WQU2_9PORP|nr:PorV/PorQ family protein [Porphyromonas levii]MBR8703086.1 hypothetical protein [Porphyromonas levii]MBR8713719.1 hypothetical protein [Porphyromonas levii]MBR8715715.1 hypothetical protein [Porphyromonas levii]MBR8728280.1 hypothetical protein [Porphyromonas levii]MBR8736384.1 hypothetical protein [Porphyromonas levii]
MIQIYNVNRRGFALLAVLLIASICTPWLHAQSGRAFTFLDYPTDARALALGRATLLHSHQHQIYLNPGAFMDQDRHFSVGVTSDFFPLPESKVGDKTYSTISLAARIHPNHALFAGFRFHGGYGYRTLLDQWGKQGKLVTPFDWTADIGYAIRLSYGLSLFATGGLLTTYNGQQGTYGALFSLGANWQTQLMLAGKVQELNLALRLADVGPKVTYPSKDSFSLPTRLEMEAELTVDLDVVHQLTPVVGARYYFPNDNYSLFQAHMGLEYRYAGFIALRSGCLLGSNDSHWWSTGGGITYRGFDLQIGYAKHFKLSKANIWSATLGFNF